MANHWLALIGITGCILSARLMKPHALLWFASNYFVNVLAWPRRGFVASARSITSPSSCSAVQCRSLGGTTNSEIAKKSLPPRSSLPIFFAGSNRSPYGSHSTLFRGCGGSELSWCAQSILSLPLTDDYSNEDRDTADESESSSLSGLSSQRSMTEIERLDVELLAVQKMVQKQGAETRRRASILDRKSLAMSNPNIARSFVSTSRGTVRSATPDIISRPRVPVIDNRHRQLPCINPSPHTKPKAAFVIKPALPSANGVESFMREAEPDFDEGIHFLQEKHGKTAYITRFQTQF